jgi:hypothetical protein
MSSTIDAGADRPVPGLEARNIGELRDLLDAAVAREAVIDEVAAALRRFDLAANARDAAAVQRPQSLQALDLRLVRIEHGDAVIALDEVIIVVAVAQQAERRDGASLRGLGAQAFGRDAAHTSSRQG